MRGLVCAALLMVALGCGSSDKEYGKPIGEPKGYRFVTKSDPVGTVVYERGIQWINSDHAPTHMGPIKELSHIATEGSYKGMEVVTVTLDSGNVYECPTGMFYEGGTKFVKN